MAHDVGKSISEAPWASSGLGFLTRSWSFTMHRLEESQSLRHLDWWTISPLPQPGSSLTTATQQLDSSPPCACLICLVKFLAASQRTPPPTPVKDCPPVPLDLERFNHQQLPYTTGKEPGSPHFHFQRKNQSLLDSSVNGVKVTVTDC